MTVKSSDEKYYDFFRYAVRITRRKTRFVDIAAGLLSIFAVLCALVLIFVIADHNTDQGLSSSTRFAILCMLGILTLGLLAWRVILPLIKRINDIHITRTIEKSNPQFRTDLTTALELGQNSATPHSSINAIVKQACQGATTADVTEAVNLKSLKIAGLLMLISFLSFTGYAIVSPKSIWPAVKRVAFNSQVAPATVTQIIRISPDNNSIFEQGKKVRFSVTVQSPGELPPTVVLAKVDPKNPEKLLPLETLTMKSIAPENRHSIWTADWITLRSHKKVSFIVRAGDAQSKPRFIEIVPPVIISNITTLQNWPAYTASKPLETINGIINAPANTAVTVRAKINQPVTEANIVFESGAVPVAAKISGKNLSANFTIDAADKYRIVVETKKLRRVAKSAWHEIELIKDRAPAVILTMPDSVMELSTIDTARLSCNATDDFGIANIDLIIKGTDEKIVIPVNHFSQPGPLRKTIKFPIAINMLGDPGDIVTGYFQARDFRPRRGKKIGQTGRSEYFKILITKPTSDQLAQKRAQKKAAADLEKSQNQSGQNSEENTSNSENSNQAGQQNQQSDQAGKTDSWQQANPKPDANQNSQNKPDSDKQKKADQDSAKLLQAPQSDMKKLNQLEKKMGQKNKKSQNATAGSGQAGAKTGDPKKDDSAQKSGQQGDSNSSSKSGDKSGKSGEQKTGDKSGKSGDQKPGDKSGKTGEQKPGDKSGKSGDQKTGDKSGKSGEQKPGDESGKTGDAKKGNADKGQVSGESKKQNPLGEISPARKPPSENQLPDSGGKSQDAPAKIDAANSELLNQQAQIKRLESIGKALENAKLKIETGEVDPKLLTQLGMTNRQFKNFVEKYSQRVKLATNQLATKQKVLRAKIRQFEKDKLAGVGVPDLKHEITGVENSPRDINKNIRTRRARKVSPRYRARLRDFLRNTAKGDSQE